MTPLEKLQATYKESYSHVPFETFVAKVHEKHYSHVPFADFTDKLGLTAPPETDQTQDAFSGQAGENIPIPGVSTENTPNLQAQGTYREAIAEARPLLQYGGLALGGFLGGVPGAGLLYGAGKGIADMAEGKEEGGVGSAFLGAGRDVAEGMTMEMGGQAVGNLIGRGANAIASNRGLARKWYGSAVKMPLSRKWVKARGPEGNTDVKIAIDQGLKNEVPPSSLGLQQTKTAIKEVGGAIDRDVSSMSGEYATKDILKKGLKNTVDDIRTGKSENIDADLNKVIDYAKSFAKGRPEKLSAAELNDIKKTLYKLADYDKASGVADSLTEKMRKGLAHEAMIRLQNDNPALKDLNADYAGWKLLEEALERALPRINNRDVIGLGTKVLVGREAWPFAIWNATIGHPSVKAQIAFMLKNANRVTGSTVARPTGYTAGSLLFNEQ